MLHLVCWRIVVSDRSIPGLFGVLLLMLNYLLKCNTDMHEYCFPDTFNVSCRRDEVIVITAARYGRMNKGLCLSSDYHVGCWMDVLPHLDRRCSGRHHCHITIPDTTLHNIQPCPKDMLAYLQSDYLCQKVQTRPSFSCKHAGELIATASERPDFLANIISEVDGFGSPRCPWIIAAPRGQKINISLIDFGMTSLSAPPPTSSSAEYEPESPRNVCLIYAKIREQGSAYHDVRVCDQDKVAREKQVYVSDSTRVQVALMNLVDTGNDPIYFLLKYEAVGCTDPRVPRGATLKRDGLKAKISCDLTAQTWHIVCQGTRWSGVTDNCTIDTLTFKSSTHVSTSLEITDIYPVGLLLAVSVGLILGIVIGIAWLSLAISCHKKIRRTKLTASQRVTSGANQRFPVLYDNQYYPVSTSSRCQDQDECSYYMVYGIEPGSGAGGGSAADCSTLCNHLASDCSEHCNNIPTDCSTLCNHLPNNNS